MDISDFSDEYFLLSGENVQVTSVKTIVQVQDGSIHILPSKLPRIEIFK